MVDLDLLSSRNTHRQFMGGNSAQVTFFYGKKRSYGPIFGASLKDWFRVTWSWPKGLHGSPPTALLGEPKTKARPCYLSLNHLFAQCPVAVCDLLVWQWPPSLGTLGFSRGECNCSVYQKARVRPGRVPTVAQHSIGSWPAKLAPNIAPSLLFSTATKASPMRLDGWWPCLCLGTQRSVGVDLDLWLTQDWSIYRAPPSAGPRAFEDLPPQKEVRAK